MSSMELDHDGIEIDSKVIEAVLIYVLGDARETSEAEFRDGRSEPNVMASLCSRKLYQAVYN